MRTAEDAKLNPIRGDVFRKITDPIMLIVSERIIDSVDSDRVRYRWWKNGVVKSTSRKNFTSWVKSADVTHIQQGEPNGQQV